MTRNLWLSAFAIVISILTYFALGSWVAKWVVDSLVLGVASGMAWTWTPAARRAIWRGVIDGSDKVILTIWLAWTVLFVQRIYTMINVALDRPDWLASSLVPQLIATLIFLAGIFGLAAPASETRELPRGDMLVVVSGWFVTGIVTGATAAYLLIIGI